ncbi:MAG: 23S rRNA (pseudouridine(1915)-N(3))-methyltransferase RlmH [Candidatus Moraniibacteriota bacterium]|jgi:23S rRNA (pseudouridine1915-N3)-methyltransferase
MKLKIITIGEPKLSFAKEGFNEYIKRLNAFHSIEIVHLKDGVEDKKILDVIDNIFCVILDEKGKQFTSKKFATFIDEKAVRGVSEMCFVIGGPDGHNDEIKDRADVLLSFGEMTLPHDLAMVILVESLYRASTINVNHPYHRE